MALFKVFISSAQSLGWQPQDWFRALNNLPFPPITYLSLLSFLSLIKWTLLFLDVTSRLHMLTLALPEFFSGLTLSRFKCLLGRYLFYWAYSDFTISSCHLPSHLLWQHSSSLIPSFIMLL